MTFTMEGRRRVVVTFALVTAVKIAVFLALDIRGAVKLFEGGNAVEHYLPVAARIVSEGRFNGPDSRPDSKVPPGYPAVIAATLLLTRKHAALLVIVLQMIADGMTALVIIYGLGSRIATRAAASLAGLIWLLFPPADVISTYITSETFFTLLLALGVTAAAYALEADNPRRALAAGLLLGMATLFRPTSLCLPAFFLPVFWRVRRMRLWLIATAAMALVILPWTLRNWVVLHDWIPVSVGSGAAVLQGSDAGFFSGPGKLALYPGVFESARGAGLEKPPGDHESAIDAWMGRVGFWVYRRRLSARPLSVAPFLVYKCLRMFYGAENAPPWKQVLVGICSFLVVPPGIWQLSRARRRHRGVVYLLLASFGAFFFVHLAFVPEIRYVIPVYPLIIPGAAAWYLSLVTGEPAGYQDAGADSNSGG